MLGDRASTVSRSGGFRPDIEGLRAVAVGAVLLDHAGVPFLAGGYVGVDVFFVISGFLITRMLVSEIERTGTISLVSFYARRIRRLLPSAMTVLVAIAIGSALFLSATRLDQVSGDLVAAGLYVVNWRFAAQAIDYFGATLQASPVQHFWSLAVEEQFYILWPALLLAVTWRRRGRGGLGVKRAVWIALAVVGLVSFVYGVHVSNDEAGAAYFSTPARVWELALGGLLALGPGVLPRLPARAVQVLSWGGLGAIVLSCLLFDHATTFPGTAALLPTLGTAALITAGANATQTRPLRLLQHRAARHVGRISYVWYLWHWPLLVFAAALWGPLSAWAGLLVVAVSWIPSVLTHRFVEDPFRRAQTFVRLPRRGLGLGSACAGATVCMGLLLPLTAATVPTAPANAVTGAQDMPAHPAIQQRATAVRPNPRDASADRGDMFADGCLLTFRQTQSPPCVYGDPASPTTVVLFGDSHAMQYGPALEELARQRHWRLVGLTKEGCSPAQAREYLAMLGREYSECDTWRTATLDRIVNVEHPDLVIVGTSATYRVYGADGSTVLDRTASNPFLRAGYEATLRRLVSTGTPVAVIADPPRAPADTPDCVAASLSHLESCAFPSGPVSAPAFDTEAASAVPGVRVIDPQPMLCPGGRCPAVIGSALVYRDAGHLTATFARTLAPWLGARLPAPATAEPSGSG